MNGTGHVDPEEKYLKNLDYIQKAYPDLSTRILKSRPFLEAARSGLPTLKIGGIYIESRYDPRESAEKRVTASWRRHEAALFLGSGLGYHINFLFRHGIRRAILIEKDPLLFHAALYVLEPKYLRSLLLFIDQDLRRVQEGIEQLLTIPFTLVKHAQSIQLSNAYYLSVERIIKKSVKEKIASKETELGMQKRWVRNIIRNLFHAAGRYIATCDLAGAFSGPVLLLASGPFLEDVIDHVRRLKDRLPLFALLPSLPYLLTQGVQPDLILSTDAGFGNLYRFVRGTDIPLVSTYSAHPGLLKNWKGRVLPFSHGLPLEQNLMSLKRWSMCIPMQGTSSAVMILFARVLGFAPIYLAGFDFAYIGLKDHHRGAGFDAFHTARMDRFSTWDTQVFVNFRKDKPMEKIASSGTRIYSTHKLTLYCEWVNRVLAGEDLFRISDGLAMENLHSLIPERLALTGSGPRKEFQRRITHFESSFIPPPAFEEDLSRLEGALSEGGGEAERMFYGEACERGGIEELQREVIHLRHLFYTQMEKRRARA